jgi:hypothetical protein
MTKELSMIHKIKVVTYEAEQMGLQAAHYDGLSARAPQ